MSCLEKRLWEEMRSWMRARVLGDSILDIFEAEESEDEALRGLANGLEDIDIIELIERCSVVLEQFEARS